MLAATITTLTYEKYDLYANFCKHAFGPHSYQAQIRFIKWIHSHRNNSILLGIANEEIVGAITIITFPQQRVAPDKNISMLTDFYIKKEFRGSTTLAGSLFSEAYRIAKKNVVMSGVEGKLTALYSSFIRFNINVAWSYYIRTSIFPRNCKKIKIVSSTQREEFMLTLRKDKLFFEMCGAEFISWRFFNKRSPLSVAVFFDESLAAISSYGRHGFVKFSRIIYLDPHLDTYAHTCIFHAISVYMRCRVVAFTPPFVKNKTMFMPSGAFKIATKKRSYHSSLEANCPFLTDLGFNGEA